MSLKFTVTPSNLQGVAVHRVTGVKECQRGPSLTFFDSNDIIYIAADTNFKAVNNAKNENREPT